MDSFLASALRVRILECDIIVLMEIFPINQQKFHILCTDVVVVYESAGSRCMKVAIL